MKRLLFILLCAMCASSVTHAQYRVYAHQGDVQYKRHAEGASSKWQPISDDLALASIDSVKISDGASVRIEFIQPHTIYTSSHVGITAVVDLVRKAKNENARHIGKAMNREIASGRTQPVNMHAMGVIGSGSRAIISSDSLEILADMFAWIGAQACTDAPSPLVKGFKFKRHKVGGEWDFEFENGTDKDYHMNVIHVNKRTKTVSLCYVVTPEIEAEACPITPSGFCTCALDVYFPDTSDDVYVLVATEMAYDTSEMDNELLYHPIDKAKKSDMNVKYMW